MDSDQPDDPSSGTAPVTAFFLFALVGFGVIAIGEAAAVDFRLFWWQIVVPLIAGFGVGLTTLLDRARLGHSYYAPKDITIRVAAVAFAVAAALLR